MRAQSMTPKRQIEPARDDMVPDYYETSAGSTGNAGLSNLRRILIPPQKFLKIAPASFGE
jgi:hypothetical protein